MDLLFFWLCIEIRLINSDIFHKLIIYFSKQKSFLQVSLRDPLRNGADDAELREIIGAAVCVSQFFYTTPSFKHNHKVLYAYKFLFLIPVQYTISNWLYGGQSMLLLRNV